MAVGYSADKPNIDSRAGYIAQSVRDSLDSASRFNVWLQGKTDADLTEVGYDGDDILLLRSAFFELDALNSVAKGQAEQEAPTDFFWNARKLIGVN